VPSTNTIHQTDVGGPRFTACTTTAILVIAPIVSGVSTLAAALIPALQAG
jgi:hypothetical protein